MLDLFSIPLRVEGCLLAFPMGNRSGARAVNVASGILHTLCAESVALEKSQQIKGYAAVALHFSFYGLSSAIDIIGLEYREIGAFIYFPVNLTRSFDRLDPIEAADSNAGAIAEDC
jgi:hypothetical protein